MMNLRKRNLSTAINNDTKEDKNEIVVTSSIEKKKNSKRKLEEMKSSIKLKKKEKKTDIPVPKSSNYTNLGTGPTPTFRTGKKFMGCHVSAAGGVWNSFKNGEQMKAQSLAMFLRSQRSWNAKILDKADVEKWKTVHKDSGIKPHLILPHGSYLMNLGSPKLEMLEKSRKLFIEELQRCDSLEIPNFNFHPGSSLGEISREECCKIIAESINIGHDASENVICVIENMSKQGFTIGGDLNEIRLIIENVKNKSRVGVCLDTCHAHAAGYDLSSEDGFENFINDFETIIGWQFLRGIHMNDSKGNCGDHKDRHESIGKGTIGIEGFRRIMNCDHFNDLPLILETPYIDDNTYAKEISLLQSLIKS